MVFSMGNRINYHEDYKNFERTFNEDFQDKGVEKSSVFSRAYKFFKDVLYLLKNTSTNASKVINYDALFEERMKLSRENKGLRQDTIEMGGKLGELREEHRKTLEEVCGLTKKCESKDRTIDSFFDTVYELVGESREKGFIIYSILNKEKNDSVYEKLSELKNLCKLQKKVIARSNKEIKKLGGEVDKKHSLLIKSYEGLKSIFHSDKKDKKRQEEINKIRIKLWRKNYMSFDEMNELIRQEGIKGLRKKYVEYFNVVKEKREEKRKAREDARKEKEDSEKKYLISNIIGNIIDYKNKID